MDRSQPTTVEEANRIATDNNRYVFKTELGKGSFAVVFHAYDNKEQKPVAIKIAIALVNAAQEKDVLEEIQHKNVVAFKRFYLFSRRSGLLGLAIVTELCERGDLQSHLKEMSRSRTKLEIDARVKWYKQLAEGLSFIHSKNIVHRDLKPANILLDCHDNLKIADVGLAKAIWEAKTANQELAVDCTYEQYLSTIAGTRPYMAPEVWNGHYQMSSDVFSLGLIFVVMSELPANLIPIAYWSEKGYSLGELMRSVQITLPTQILRCSQSKPFELKLFDRMLQCDYHKRINMMDVITKVNEIEVYLRTESSVGSPIELTSKTPDRNEANEPYCTC